MKPRARGKHGQSSANTTDCRPLGDHVGKTFYHPLTATNFALNTFAAMTNPNPQDNPRDPPRCAIPCGINLEPLGVPDRVFSGKTLIG